LTNKKDIPSKKNSTQPIMKRKIRTADNWLEISAAVIIITLYLFGKISIGYTLLGVVLSLSLIWPFKAKKRSHS